MDVSGGVVTHMQGGQGLRIVKQWALISVAIFVATVALMMLWRKFLLPMVMPEISQGLFAVDPLYYQNLAVALAQDMKGNGWAVWTLRPAGQAPAGILAAIYYFTGPDSRLVIPLNALLHVVGTIALYGIIRCFVSWKIAAILCVPYWLSPYYMHWYAQPNKDSFAGAGVMILVYGWIEITELFLRPRPRSSKLWFYALFLVLAGTALMGMVRPYLVSIAVFSGTAYFCWLLLCYARGYQLEGAAGSRDRGVKLVTIFLLLSLSALLSWSDFEEKSQASRMEFVKHSSTTELWHRTGWIPEGIENKIAVIVVAHRGSFRDLLADRNQATRDALIDLNYRFESIGDVAAFMPRAVQIGLFAPFPEQWSFFGVPSRSVFWNIAAWQMIGAYGAYAFLIWGVFRFRERPTLIVVAGFSLSYIVVYAVAVPHLGALDRYRYPWLCLLMTVGFACGVRCWQEWRASSLLKNPSQSGA